VLLAVAAVAGLVIGATSGQTVLMRSVPGGGVLARSGWASAIFWVLGMGSRFAFLIWITHGGAAGPIMTQGRPRHTAGKREP